MTAKVSPKAASGRALKEVRCRLKSQRLNESVQSPADMADRLVRILTPAAVSDPAPDSPAYRAYVEAQFSDRFFELCKMTPARWRA